MKIRRARFSDLPAIESIAKQVDLVNYSYAYRFLVWWGRVFVVTIKNKVVAFLSYIAIPLTENVFCLQIGVSPETQGKGIGKKLMAHLKKIGARFHQARYVWAHTVKPRALSYFKRKMRFKVVASAFGVSVIHSPEIKEEEIEGEADA